MKLKKYCGYERNQLQKAFQLTTKNISVYKAARLCGVPEQTLRDRVKGHIRPDQVPGSNL